VVRSACRVAAPGSEFAGFRFPPEVITLAVRWYLRFGLSYRDVEELLAERGIEVDHATLFRWVARFTPLFTEAARPCRHTPGDRWFIDETYVKVLGRWRYLYRAVDQFGQVIDALLSPNRDKTAARRFFTRALAGVTAPAEVTTAGPGRTRGCSTSCCPSPSTSPCATRTTGSRPTTAGSSPGFGHARPETRPLAADRRGRACLRTEPAARPLRTRNRGLGPGSRGGRIHRTRRRHLIDPARQQLPPAPPRTTQQRPPM